MQNFTLFGDFCQALFVSAVSPSATLEDMASFAELAKETEYLIEGKGRAKSIKLIVNSHFKDEGETVAQILLKLMLRDIDENGLPTTKGDEK